MKFKDGLGNAPLKECLWNMEESLQGLEGENDEVSQCHAKIRKQHYFTNVPHQTALSNHQVL
ncbi:MAG: hypothetical protein QXK93_03100 [Candidatus Bathyarchaeia archaeon]|nr:hypothetical protein [Candidatus Bathyarchaeota archaeon]